MPNARKDQEIAMLRSEIEMLMKERENLLKVAGAAAVFVANMDSKILPEDSWDAAEVLAENLNVLREETLKDALESVKVKQA